MHGFGYGCVYVILTKSSVDSYLSVYENESDPGSGNKKRARTVCVFVHARLRVDMGVFVCV